MIQLSGLESNAVVWSGAGLFTVAMCGLFKWINTLLDGSGEESIYCFKCGYGKRLKHEMLCAPCLDKWLQRMVDRERNATKLSA